MEQVLHHPRAPGAVGSSLYPQAGQVVTGRKVVKQLKLNVGLISSNTRAPQPGPYISPKGGGHHRGMSAGGQVGQEVLEEGPQPVGPVGSSLPLLGFGRLRAPGKPSPHGPARQAVGGQLVQT